MGANKNPEEDSIKNPENPYGETKLAAENLLEDVYLSSRINGKCNS